MAIFYSSVDRSRLSMGSIAAAFLAITVVFITGCIPREEAYITREEFEHFVILECQRLCDINKCDFFIEQRFDINWTSCEDFVSCPHCIVCGDGICNAIESDSCVEDCGPTEYCGNEICDYSEYKCHFEECKTDYEYYCEKDCGKDGRELFKCGDGFCDWEEDCLRCMHACPKDCVGLECQKDEDCDGKCVGPAKEWNKYPCLAVTDYCWNGKCRCKCAYPAEITK